jgi:hypothetical protein
MPVECCEPDLRNAGLMPSVALRQIARFLEKSRIDGDGSAKRDLFRSVGRAEFSRSSPAGAEEKMQQEGAKVAKRELMGQRARSGKRSTDRRGSEIG